MSSTSTSPRLFPAETTRAFIARAFAAVGMGESDCEVVAALMTQIDLRGGDGHGIFRLAQYIKRIKAGGINVTPEITLAKDMPGMAIVDGDNAVGHLVMRRAADVAMEKAAKCGVAWVGTRNSNHAGAAAIYAMMPLEREMIGIYVAVGSANHLPPWGGTEMLLSTNPLAAAIPGFGEPPIVLDMATTVAAYGKVKMAAQRGEQMPIGWMIDREGKPLTDPNRADEGFLLPIGGYKGYGLSLLFGLLAGTLNGAAFGKDVIDFNADDTTPTNTGQYLVAIDIKAFAQVEGFKRQVDAIIRSMRSSPTLPGFDQIFLPGEQSHAKFLRRGEEGIPIPDVLLRKLDTLADELDIPGLG